MSGRYKPLPLRSSVDKSASSLESFSIRTLTKAIALTAVAYGQWRDAVNKRFAKAAERQAGVIYDAPRGVKAKCNARNSRSAVDCAFAIRVSDLKSLAGGVSMSEMRHKEGISAYRPLMKPVRSISRASPAKAWSGTLGHAGSLEKKTASP